MSWVWCHVRAGGVWASAQAGGMGSPRMASEVPGLEGGQRRELVPWPLVKFFTPSVRALGCT